MLGSPLRTMAFARRAALSGPMAPGPHYFEVDASRVPPAWIGAYGVVEGDGPLVQVASRSLIAGLERGGPAGVVWSGHEERYLAGILRDTSRGREGFSAVIAVVVGDEIIIAAIRGGQAYMCTNDSCEALLSEGDDHAVRTARISAGRANVLILGTLAMARHVRADEVRRTLAGYDDLVSPAEWLVRLASQRSRQPATVAMVECLAGPLPARLLARATQSHHRQSRDEPVVVAERVMRSPQRRGRRRMRLAVASVLALAGVVGGAVVILPRIHLRAAAPRVAAVPRPPQLRAPALLESRQLAGMDIHLAWRPVSHASRYAVTVGQHHFETTSPMLTLHDVLRTGVVYHWWVAAQYGRRHGPLSPMASLFIQPRAATQWRFAQLQRAPDQIILTLANPGAAPVSASITQVAAQPVTQVFVIPAQGSLPVQLPLAAGLSLATPIHISAQAPILPQRTVTRGTVVHTQYGTPGLAP